MKADSAVRSNPPSSPLIDHPRPYPWDHPAPPIPGDRYTAALWNLARISIVTLAVLIFVVGGTARAAQDDGAQPTEPEAVRAADAFEALEAIDRPATSYLSLASDPENCLSCHRFRGLSRLDPETGELRLFFCSAEYYARKQGPHSRLRCTACHDPKQVTVIPHRDVTPVSCTSECHLVPASGMEIRFSHDTVAERLARSVHSAEGFASWSPDEPLLRPGQSECLYCHDEPVYRSDLPGISSHRGIGVEGRCDTCHDETLPVDTPYYLRHTASRLQSARPVRQLVQVCAVCHSDPDAIEHMQSHDAVASYLHSFHGKASLLGSIETATCVDCHSSETGDVHTMLASADPASPTHPDRVVTTCRTEVCHPNASPGMTSAAVHLDLDPQARTPEFYFAAAFILLTAAVMTLYFLLILLELFGAVVRPVSTEHRALVRLARKVLAHPEGAALLRRLTVHQRVQHWLLAIFFITLVVTGMPLKFADAAWASALADLLGGVTSTRHVHRIAGVALCTVFVHHIGYMAVLFWRRARQLRREGVSWPLLRAALDSPIMLNFSDIKEFGGLFLYLLFLRKHRPPQRHFHFSQKFEYLAVFWGMFIIGLSGIALWAAPWFSDMAGGRALNFAFIMHSDEAYLAFIYIAVVHIYTVILSPVVFPLSLGSLSGNAPAAEIAEGHATQLAAVAEQLGIEPPDGEPDRSAGWGRRLLGLLRRAYSLALLVLVAAVTFASMQFLAHLLLSKPRAPVEVTAIPLRLNADTLTGDRRGLGEDGETLETRQLTRGPLAHFHQIPPWYDTDPGNSCTVSGCHAMLPHGSRIEDRAFLNMHTTFVDCRVCHLAAVTDGMQVDWFDTGSRQSKDTPAVLELAALLEELDETSVADRGGTSRQMIDLLRRAVDESYHDPALARWLLRLETTNSDSVVWERVVRDIRVGIPLHVHGEYAAKLGLFEDGRLAGSEGESQRRASERLRAEPDLSDAERQQSEEIVHDGVRREGALCLPCHSLEPTLLDFADLGYSPRRVESLKSSAVVRQCIAIESGQTFYLPQILEQDRED